MSMFCPMKSHMSSSHVLPFEQSQEQLTCPAHELSQENFLCQMSCHMNCQSILS